MHLQQGRRHLEMERWGLTQENMMKVSDREKTSATPPFEIERGGSDIRDLSKRRPLPRIYPARRLDPPV